MPELDQHVQGIGPHALRAAIEPAAPLALPKDLLSSVSRALEVLEIIASSPNPLTAKTVAHRLHASLGTTYHVLHTLEHPGYIVRLGHGRFGLGPKVSSLYRLFRDQLDLLPAVRPLLIELAERAQEDAYLAVFRDEEIVVAEVIEASQALHVDGLEVGFTKVAHSTAIGKVLLAGASEETVEGYLDERRLVAFTRQTLVEKRHIKRHLKVVRELGVGKDLEELASGCCCVAAPILDAHGSTVAAIGISTPAGRWRDEEKDLIDLCTEIATRSSNVVAEAAVH